VTTGLDDALRFAERYQQWATARVFEAAARAGDAANAAVIPGSNGGGTVHGLLGHIVDADIHWLNRWLGNERSQLQMPGAWPTLAEVEAAWRADAERREQFYAGLTPENVQREYGFYRGNPPTYDRQVLWQTIVHAHNHATHHRAEVCALLTTAGFAPASVDMIDFMRGN
jgi:uncharacterized damage-inducible protein DinB